jgi:hypothetical protein
VIRRRCALPRLYVAWMCFPGLCASSVRLAREDADTSGCHLWPAAFERSELKAGRGLPVSKTGASVKTLKAKDFPSRAAEGEWLSKKAYSDQ